MYTHTHVDTHTWTHTHVHTHTHTHMYTHTWHELRTGMDETGRLVFGVKVVTYVSLPSAAKLTNAMLFHGLNSLSDQK